MSLSKWFSHHLELFSLMDAIGRGQRGGLNRNFPFPKHASGAGQWLGEVLLFGFSKKTFEAS